MSKYLIIAEKAVDMDERIKATKILAYARKQLKLPMIHIKWFTDAGYAKFYDERDIIGSFERDGKILGLFNAKEPDVIFVKTSLPDGVLQETVAHEAFHAWQLSKPPIGHDKMEEFADGFSKELTKAMKTGDLDDAYHEHLMGKDWSLPSDARQSSPTVESHSQIKKITKTRGSKGNIDIEKSRTDAIIPGKNYWK